MRRLKAAGAFIAGPATLLLVASIVLNDRALSVEGWMVSDDAFGALAIGAGLGTAICGLEVRNAMRGVAGNRMLRAVLAAALSLVAVIGAFLALAEPSVFNAGYGCLGSGTEVWLAVAMKPTPAPCGYLIPASDESLFVPAAVAAFAAAALGVASAVLNLAGRGSAPT